MFKAIIHYETLFAFAKAGVVAFVHSTNNIANVSLQLKQHNVIFEVAKRLMIVLVNRKLSFAQMS